MAANILRAPAATCNARASVLQQQLQQTTTTTAAVAISASLTATASNCLRMVIIAFVQLQLAAHSLRVSVGQRIERVTQQAGRLIWPLAACCMAVAFN